MKARAATVQEYIDALPDERKQAIDKLRSIILKNLPAGFSEVISYGMISYVVPHNLYPKGYHCDPKQPLPFVSLASQKNFIALYHMGMYANQHLLQWFIEEYSKHSKIKLDMGKSCIRFKKIEQIPYELIAELASKITPIEWIKMYESQIKRK